MIEIRRTITLPPSLVTDHPLPPLPPLPPLSPSRPPQAVFQPWDQPLLHPDAFGNFPFETYQEKYMYTVLIGLLDSIKGMQDAYMRAEAQLLPAVEASLIQSGYTDNVEYGSLEELEKNRILLDELINSSEIQIAAEYATARAFFNGRNPHDFAGVPAFDYMYKQLLPKRAVNKVFQAWVQSYQAQYKAALLETQLAYLHRQKKFVEYYIKEQEDKRPSLPNPPEQQPLPQKALPMALGALAIPASAGISLSESLAAAVSRVMVGGAAAGAAAIGSTVAVVAGVLAFPTTLGDGTRFPATLPLGDLYTPDADLRALAEHGGNVSLPVRMGLMGEDEHIQLYVASTKNGAPDNVRVRQARYDAAQGVYSFTTADSPPRTLIWTPIAQPGDSSTVSPPTDIPKPDYSGPVLLPVDPYIEEFPSLAEGGFDDYIIIFPADSGLEPVYVMFRDPRDEPGVASGFGVRVEGAWLPSAANEGARIPESIARKLAGKEFSSFNAFRRSFWRAVSEDSQLKGQFGPGQVSRMLNGLAPFAPKLESAGGRVKYELHHLAYISRGGEVYGIDNLVIMTPRSHIELHNKKEDN